MVHTMPRMTANEFLDDQSRVQNLKKDALEAAKFGEELLGFAKTENGAL
jgi:hypothetical protein